MQRLEKERYSHAMTYHSRGASKNWTKLWKSEIHLVRGK